MADKVEKVTLEKDGQKTTTTNPTTVNQLKAEGWQVKRTSTVTEKK